MWGHGWITKLALRAQVPRVASTYKMSLKETCTEQQETQRTTKKHNMTAKTCKTSAKRHKMTTNRHKMTAKRGKTTTDNNNYKNSNIKQLQRDTQWPQRNTKDV